MSSIFNVVFLSLLISTDLSIEDEKRIYGGRYANPGEFPWMVFIKVTDELNCSGYLISSSYILTAAHCMISPLQDMIARIGNIDSDSGQVYTFRSFSKHPDYDNNTLYGDIALLKLSNPVTFTPDVNRICLPSNNAFYNHETPVLQMGWGRFSNTSKEVTKILKVTDIGKVYGHNECQQLFDSLNITLPNGHVCVKNSGIDGVCEGDTGGPLVVKRGTEYTAIRSDSVGFYANCSIDNNFVEIFNDIFYHRQWIIDQMDETICEN
uniref:Chymotrypsin-like protease-1 n=1 Tax=Mesobuthus eupeus TaxID=34648 RepID=E4VP21_MESEU|nr:chymotrypsin-like protease-1 [Mesobuthus eupeus]